MQKLVAGSLVMLFAVVTGFVVIFASVFGDVTAACGGTGNTIDQEVQAGPDGLDGNNPPLFAEIDRVAKGDNRLIASKYFGSFIESRRNNEASDGEAVGVFQIQKPGEPYPNPNITVAQAKDPVYATNYMLPRYQAALRTVEPALWLTDPMAAAELTAYRAEKPAGLYRSVRGIDDTQEAWANTIAWMKARGISTDFSGNAPAAPAPVVQGASQPDVSVDSNQAALNAIDEFGLGPVKLHLAAVVAEVAPRFDIDVIGGWRASARDMQGHPAGLAADFMTSVDQGNQLAEYLVANADRLAVDYVIWRQRIWFADQPQAGWAAMADRGSPTQNHMDHVHLNVRPGAGMPVLVAAGQMPVIQCSPAMVAAGAPVGDPSTVSGDAQTLARKVLALPPDRIKYIFGSREDIQATADGSRPAARPGEKCPSTRPVAVSAELLQLILDITERYSITLGSVNATRGCDGGRHPVGRGGDINAINGVPITGNEHKFTGSHQDLYMEFMDYVASILPRGNWVDGEPVGMGGLGQQQCFGANRPELDGRNIFADACTHIHLDAGVAPSPT